MQAFDASAPRSRRRRLRWCWRLLIGSWRRDGPDRLQPLEIWPKSPNPSTTNSLAALRIRAARLLAASPSERLTYPIDRRPDVVANWREISPGAAQPGCL